MKPTIQIKTTSGNVLYDHTCEDNSVTKTVEEAVKNNISLQGADLLASVLYGAKLRYADLRGADLRGADLSGADLRGANLVEANLIGADLRGANLVEANLCGAYLFEADQHGADLCGADLSGANLCGADLSGADLCGADLRGADLRGADLSGADLRGANLCGADLRGADLSGANLVEANLIGAYLSNVKADHTTAMFFPQCPDGEFVGYKKAGGKIVKLLIPADAKRSSATTLKCRCSKAKVLEIQEIDGSPSEVKEVRSKFDNDFIYRVGETVCVEDFDDNRWNECSTGIHFFISRDTAVSY